MRKNLNKMRQDRAAKAKIGRDKETRLNALLDKTELNDAEQAELTALETECDTLATEIAAMDAEIGAEERRARRAGLFATTAAATVMFAGAVAGAGTPARSVMVHDLNPATTGGFYNLADFAVAVRNQVGNLGTDPRLASWMNGENGEQRVGAAPANFHQTQGSAGEGILVPADYRDNMWQLAFPEHDLLRLCSPEPTNSNAIGMPKDESTPWGNTGVQAAWRAEASQMTASKFALSTEMLQLHELYAFCGATSELLADAPRLNNRLTVQAARAINWKASDAVMWGDGNGKPLGFMSAKALVTIAKESGQANTTLVVMNLAKMLARFIEAGGMPVWIANRDILPQLIGLSLGNQPVWIPFNQGFVGAPGGFLLGYPLYFNEHAQTLGTLGDINLVDLQGYALATKIGAGIEFASSIHLWFDYNMEAFRWTFRLGGQPYMSKPVSPANGSSSKSNFVTLAAR